MQNDNVISKAEIRVTASESGSNAERFPRLSKRDMNPELAEKAQTNAARRARVLVAEHNAFVRESVVSLINGQPDLRCCGEADSVASVPAAVAKYKPDLVVMEWRFKDGDAFELMNSLSSDRSRPAILVLSQCEEVLYAERALQAGAKGYVMKVEAAHELLNAIQTVLAGRVYLSPAMSARLVQRVLKPGLKTKEEENAQTKI